MEHNSRMQILIAAVNQDKKTLPETMNIQCDAVVVNQCGRKGKEAIAAVSKNMNVPKNRVYDIYLKSFKDQ